MATAVLLLTSASVSPAQSAYVASSNRIRPLKGDWARHQGLIEIRHLGQCVYGKDPAAAKALLLTAPRSEDESEVANALQSRMDHCISLLSGAISFDTPSLRGAIAEGVFIKAYPSDPDYARATIPVSVPADWAKQSSDKDVALGVALHEFAGCVVNAAPADVTNLIRSDPDSPGEATAFRQLIPRFPPCLTRGEKFSSDKPALRALLSEELLRKAMAVPAAGESAAMRKN